MGIDKLPGPFKTGLLSFSVIVGASIGRGLVILFTWTIVCCGLLYLISRSA